MHCTYMGSLDFGGAILQECHRNTWLVATVLDRTGLGGQLNSKQAISSA